MLSDRKYGQTNQEFSDYSEKNNEILDKIDGENPYTTIVTGDYNSHHHSWFSGDNSDNYGYTMQEIFESHGLHQTVNQPTFITGNSKTCIDLVCTDQPNMIINKEIHPSLHSTCHHQVNFVKLNLKCPPPPPYKRFVWHYGRANVESMRGAIRKYDWTGTFGAMDHPDDQVKHFDDIIMNIAKHLFHTKKKHFIQETIRG